MDFADNKKWIFYLALGVLFTLGLKWANQRLLSSNADLKVSEFNYEMIRPHQYSNSFSLVGREVDRSILTDEEQRQLDKGNPRKQADSMVSEPRKKQADPNGKTSTSTAKKTAAKNGDKNKKGSLSLNTVNTNQEMDSFASTDSNQSSDSNANNASGTQIVQDIKKEDGKKATANSSKKNEEEKKKTIAEWRQQFGSASGAALTQITQEFLTAFQKQEVSDSDFYQLAFELFTDQNQTKEATGENLLSNSNSVHGFTYLAKEYGKVSEDLRAKLWKIMLSYAQSSKFNSLVIAIGSKDSGVINLTLQVINVAVQNQKISIAAIPVDGGVPSRGLAGSTPSSAFQIFLNPLTEVVKSNDSTNLPVAESLINEIQNLLKTT